MPRLVAAAILIQLSWPLVTGLIYLTAQISWGLEGLIFLPFGGRDNLDIGVILEGIGGNGGLTAIFVGGVLYGLAGAPMLMAMVTMVLLALFVAFVTLLFRQIVIILLVVTAPIAIVAWVLPNTEKLWKFWWGTLTKALLMYPMILLLFAGGRIGAYILSASIQSGGISETVGMIGAIVIFFAPFFLVGKTFGMAGGAIGMVGGALAARAGKMQGFMNKRAMNKQGQKWGERKDRAKKGDLFSGTKFIPGSNRLASGANRLTRGVGAGIKFGDKRSAYFDSMGMGAAEDAMKNKDFTGIMYDDNAMRAMTYGSKKEAYDGLYARAIKQGKSESEAKDMAKAATAKASLVGFGGTHSIAAAQRLSLNKTGFDDAADAMDVVNRVAGSNASLQTSLRENIKFSSKQVGRSDLGGLGNMNAEEQALFNSGDKDGARQLWNDRMTLDGLETADDASLARMHKKGMENSKDVITRHHGSGSSISGRATTAATDLTRSGVYATRGNRESINAMSNLETGGTFTPKSSDTTETFQDPNNPGKLITQPVSEQPRNETIGDAASRQPRIQNPNDPNNQPPAAGGGAGAGP